MAVKRPRKATLKKAKVKAPKRPRGPYRKTPVTGYTVTRDLRNLAPKDPKSGKYTPKRKRKKRATPKAPQLKLL